MNQRNIEALASLIMEALESVAPFARAGIIAEGKVKREAEADAEKWARYLASKGCLVPASLSDEEANAVGRQQVHHMNVSHFPTANAAVVRWVLEQMAKGEPHEDGPPNLDDL